MAALAPGNSNLTSIPRKKKEEGGKKLSFDSIGHIAAWTKAYISKHPVRREGGFGVGGSLCLRSFPALSGKVDSVQAFGPRDLCSVRMPLRNLSQVSLASRLVLILTSLKYLGFCLVCDTNKYPVLVFA